MKLHLDSNIAEGTPEELVEYLRLVEEGEKPKIPLFAYGHAHQPDEDTLKSLVGSLVEGGSYTDSTESSTDEEEEIYNDIYDKGAFYIVTNEASESALPVGAILQHQHGRMFKDSQGNLCIVSRPSFLDKDSTSGIDGIIKKQRFELAKQLGIQLKSTTDFAVEAEGKYFKVTEENADLNVGDVVTITKDDTDDIPQCTDKHGNLGYVYPCDLELLEDDEADDDAPMGYTFWYIDGVYNRTNNVLEATLDGDFEDSAGTRYTYQAVSGLIKPLNREDVRERFEEAKHYDCLLKYYSTVDEFTMFKP